MSLGCFLLDYQVVEGYSLPFAGFEPGAHCFIGSLDTRCYECWLLLMELVDRGQKGKQKGWFSQSSKQGLQGQNQSKGQEQGEDQEQDQSQIQDRKVGQEGIQKEGGQEEDSAAQTEQAVQISNEKKGCDNNLDRSGRQAGREGGLDPPAAQSSIGKEGAFQVLAA